MESQLSVEKLSKVWDLSDVNRNGKLDRGEWNITCHLTRALKQGKVKSIWALLWNPVYALR